MFLLLVEYLLNNVYTFLFIECFSGFFGINCREHCSGHCKNSEPCDPVSGMCPNGCQVGYNGTICIDCKLLGY